MKQLLTLLIGLFCTATLKADCSSSELTVFPKGKIIKQNSIFVLDGYGTSQRIILDLNKKYNIYLKNGSNKIKLLVTNIYVGQFELTQALLKPETELEAGLNYFLCIDDLPQYEHYEPVFYSVIRERDIEKPEFTSTPKEIGKSLIYLGCGPASCVTFTLPVIDSSEIIIKTILKNIETGKETTYYICPVKNKIQIGHGMCSGAFTFNEGEHYEVEFSFMDASGNMTASTERIKFTRPTEQDR